MRRVKPGHLSVLLLTDFCFDRLKWNEICCSPVLWEGSPTGRVNPRNGELSRFTVVTSDIGEEWPAPGSEDTELGVLIGPEVRHGEAEVHARVQA